MKIFLRLFVVLTLSGLLAGCLAPRGDSLTSKRAVIETMRQETLADLYRLRPAARANIQRADGYAVFSNINTLILYLGGGAGYGMAVDQTSGRKTYMKMVQVGVGLGLGVQDIRVVFVFHSRQALERFVNSGWQFGAQADAAAKAEDRGGSATGEFTVSSEVDIYTLTEAGLMAKVNLAGSKYYKDNRLNY